MECLKKYYQGVLEVYYPAAIYMLKVYNGKLKQYAKFLALVFFCWFWTDFTHRFDVSIVQLGTWDNTKYCRKMVDLTSLMTLNRRKDSVNASFLYLLKIAETPLIFSRKEWKKRKETSTWHCIKNEVFL